jgi:hypothetical protein
MIGWRRYLVAVGVVLLAGGGSVDHLRAGGSVRGPFTLTTLPSMGRVVWICGPNGSYGLGFRAFRSGATQTVTIRVGSRTLRRRQVQPGGRVAATLREELRQQVTVTQATKPGLLKARVAVDFRHPRNGFCAPYDPPGFVLVVSPRTEVVPTENTNAFAGCKSSPSVVLGLAVISRGERHDTASSPGSIFTRQAPPYSRRGPLGQVCGAH